ncbi:MAG: cation-transporting P-type ATPase, partial [Flavobacteriaceae bacterium]|nr:cation-transporting P-type ATPase [Flavobacteriaceae bacterium]
MKNPFAFSMIEVAEALNSDIKRGLSDDQVRRNLSRYGENILKEHKKKSIWIIFLQQFLDPIIYILTGAMVLAFAFSDVLEGLAILAVLFITAILGFIMEYQAIRSVEALRRITRKVSTVIRNGRLAQIKTRHLVPGDIIVLAAGDIVPADGRLIWHQSIAINESVLTGESNQVEKTEAILKPSVPITDQVNMVFKGTTVVRGNAKAMITETGNKTIIGRISMLTQEAQKVRSPLEKKLAKLSRWLILLTIVLVFVIAITAFFQGRDLLLMAKIGVALAVAAIPEGLPIVATIALARGMIRLSRKKVIIKHLEAVQTLGETTIVCTDKTGTLTENKMSVHQLELMDLSIGHHEFSSFTIENQNDDAALNQLLKVAVLCNNTRLGEKDLKGDSIEIALVHFAENMGVDIRAMRKEYRELYEIPFDPERKLMLTANAEKDHKLICAKGALENLIYRCDRAVSGDGIDLFDGKSAWLQKADLIASKGLRVMGFAYKTCIELPPEEDMQRDLIFIGLIGFLDPPRIDVKTAINTYKEAGIKVIMITGDHPNTARKIAEEVGLLEPEDSESMVVHGKSLTEMDSVDASLEQHILGAKVFARMVPEQKLDLVNFYQKHNHVVGMIGDGVNDAPAIKKADIGIAMGIRGTEAAREVADVILMDDKFTSTELAIRQGRSIFQNIRHFVVYLLSCNLAEIISVAIATLSNLPMPLLPLQILFLNLVTDVFPALALGLGKGEPGIMDEPPRDPKEPIVTKKLWQSTIVYGLCITVSVLGVTAYSHFILNYSASVVNNMAFYTLILGQLLNVFNLPARNIS